MAFGADAVVKDPLIGLTEGRPKPGDQAQQRAHDKLVSRITQALKGETERVVQDRFYALRLVVEEVGVWVYKDGSTSCLELTELGIPVLTRICGELGT